MLCIDVTPGGWNELFSVFDGRCCAMSLFQVVTVLFLLIRQELWKRIGVPGKEIREGKNRTSAACYCQHSPTSRTTKCWHLPDWFRSRDNMIFIFIRTISGVASSSFPLEALHSQGHPVYGSTGSSQNRRFASMIAGDRSLPRLPHTFGVTWERSKTHGSDKSAKMRVVSDCLHTTALFERCSSPSHAPLDDRRMPALQFHGWDPDVSVFLVGGPRQNPP